MGKFKQLTAKDVKKTREDLLKKNNMLCPILKKKIDFSESALDHAHEDSAVSDTISGQIRGTISKYANTLEGQWRSKFRRSGCANYISFEEMLLNMHEYLMNNRELLYHPTHAKHHKKHLMKSSYNQLIKEIKTANKYLEKPIKYPPYPKSKRLTKNLKKLYDDFAIIPKYYN